MGRLGVCDRHRAAQAQRLELLDGKRGQGGFGLVLVFSDQKHHPRPVVRLKLEGRPARKLGGKDRRRNILFDVLDDAVGSLEMAHVRPLTRVIHRVGQVADQDHVLARAGQVAQAERAAEHTHIGMHAHQHHVGDAAAFEQVPDLFAGIADGIFGTDLDGRGLGFPGRALRALRAVVAAAVGLVDGVDALFLSRDLVAPLADMFGKIRGFGGFLGFLAGGVILVGFHATAGGVDDQDPFSACRGDGLVHGGPELADAASGALAPVLVPHVADDDGGLGGVPAEEFFAGQGIVGSRGSPKVERRRGRERGG